MKTSISKTVAQAPIPVFATHPHTHAPLLYTLIKVSAIWGFANLGYFVLFPLFHIPLSYNTAPEAIALYFFGWFIASVYLCWDVLEEWLPEKSFAWRYGAQAIASAIIIWFAIYEFSALPIPAGKKLIPYSDLLFATPWYFFPKSIEILVQQVLITTMVLSFARYYKSLSTVMLNYAFFFGGGHVVLFASSSAPTPYALMMTFTALLSTFIAPYMVLRVRGGVLINYVLHILVYIIIASTLHTWPPPDYVI